MKSLTKSKVSSHIMNKAAFLEQRPISTKEIKDCIR